MKPNVTIIDYGMGNLLSICRAFEKVGANVIIAGSPEEILAAERLVLPGVGAFPDGMKELNNRAFVPAIHEYVKKGNLLLGICLGMQMLFDESEENVPTSGLKLISGKVKLLPKKQQNGALNKVPHVGWAEVSFPNLKNLRLSPLQSVPEGSYLYFVHSYYAIAEQEKHILSLSSFGDVKYCSSAISDNVVGTQFHPEKSGGIGLSLLKTFLEI